MNRASPAEALFYPFHLCHERTLVRLLDRFDRVHFRDYMAIALSPWSGTTAYPDRIGDAFPDLLQSGRLVQGYDVSGPLPPDVIAAVDRDLSDPRWRDMCHTALCTDRRFRYGLFGDAVSEDRATDASRQQTALTVAALRGMTAGRAGHDVPFLDYGFALLNTSAALVYTLRLATTHGLAAATDSRPHFTLLARMMERDGFSIANRLIGRHGY